MYTILIINLNKIYEKLINDNNIIAIIASLIPIFAAILTIIKILLKIFKIIIDTIVKKKIKKYQYKEFGYNIDDLTRKSLKYYIPTRGQAIDPCNAEDFDPSKQCLSFKLIPHIMKNNFKSERYYLILADSGMGKSTFLYHLFFSYYKKLFRKYEIKFIPLYMSDVLDKINNIENPQNTILLLDGLDENENINNDYNQYMNKLINATINFHTVIITCRTQFFSSEYDEPAFASFYSVNTNQKKMRFNKKYISPFNEQEINTYLRKKYNFIFQRKKLKLSKRLIMNCPKLMVRPMLLSYIDDLILNTTKEYYFAYEIYEELISKWIEREPINSDSLYNFSIKLSEYMFYHNTIFITQTEIEDLCNYYHIDIQSLDAKSRSLLNRNSDGIYKFAHKSIMEYFLAKKAMDDINFREKITHKGFDSYEMTKLFLQEMCSLSYRLLLENNPLQFEGISFRYLQLSNTDFSKKKVFYCDFIECNLSHADFSYTQFNNVRFDKSDLSNANFCHADLSHLDIAHSNLACAEIKESYLIKTTFRKTLLREAKLDGSDLTLANLSNADLQNANLIESILNKTNLNGANLSCANLQRANLSYANLSNANLSYANLDNANLSHANLCDANLSYATLNHTNLSGTYLNGINKTGANFSNILVDDLK